MKLNNLKYLFFAAIFASTHAYAALPSGVEGARGQIRIEPSLFYGFGTENHKVGMTTEGDDITISGGGGFGGGVAVGYGIQERIDVDLAFNLQNSSLRPSVNNASGNFMRKIILATGKYKLPLNPESCFKLGAGFGYYIPDEMDIDFTDAGGSKVSFKYKNAVGFHLTFDYERVFGRKSSWSAGLRYANVKYGADGVTVMGLTYPAETVSDEYNPLDGGSFDFIFAVKF